MPHIFNKPKYIRNFEKHRKASEIRTAERCTCVRSKKTTAFSDKGKDGKTKKIDFKKVLV